VLDSTKTETTLLHTLVHPFPQKGWSPLLLISRFTAIRHYFPGCWAMLLDSGWLHRFTGVSPPAGSLSAALLPFGGTGREYHYPWRCYCDTPAATAGFMDGRTRFHLNIGRHLIKADGAAESNRTEKSDFVSSPRFYRWSSRILQRRLPP